MSFADLVVVEDVFLQTLVLCAHPSLGATSPVREVTFIVLRDSAPSPRSVHHIMWIMLMGARTVLVFPHSSVIPSPIHDCKWSTVNKLANCVIHASMGFIFTLESPNMRHIYANVRVRGGINLYGGSKRDYKTRIFTCFL